MYRNRHQGPIIFPSTFAKLALLSCVFQSFSCMTCTMASESLVGVSRMWRSIPFLFPYYLLSDQRAYALCRFACLVLIAQLWFQGFGVSLHNVGLEELWFQGSHSLRSRGWQTGTEQVNLGAGICRFGAGLEDLWFQCYFTALASELPVGLPHSRLCVVVAAPVLLFSCCAKTDRSLGKRNDAAFTGYCCSCQSYCRM